VQIIVTIGGAINDREGKMVWIMLIIVVGVVILWMGGSDDDIGFP
jgi:hypothetical protein